MQKAKLFWNGRSQAVRLPKEFRFDAAEVTIRREGDAVILELPKAATEDEWAWTANLQGFDESFMAIVEEEVPWGPDDPESRSGS